MPKTNSDALFCRIDMPEQTCLLGPARGMPRLWYWGPALPAGTDVAACVQGLRRDAVPGALDAPEALSLLPERGTGFAAHPGLVAARAGSELLSQLEVTGVAAGADRIEFVCADALAEIEVTLRLTFDDASGALVIANTLANAADSPLDVHWFASAALPLPAAHRECVTLGGRWAHEFGLHRSTLGQAALVLENRLGRTSHGSFPGLLTGAPGFDAEHGDVVAAHLAWSGNHRLRVERVRDGQAMLQLGVLLAPGELTLAPGACWQAPPVCLARSSSGYNGCLQVLHEYVRHNVRRKRSRQRPRPVHFNSWEAHYFDHDEARTLALVAQAANLGAERFVLDDGWFAGRSSDRGGLGNWAVCARKYPNGLEPVFDAVRAAGMQTGLWIEPEMVNADSDVLRERPDWIVGDPARQQPLGRHQYALNLARDDVADHLFEAIGTVVERYRLDYLKWDMNRDLAHAVSGGKPASAALTDAFYRLIERIGNAWPDTDIEICASGGARADYGALRYGDRIWTSDNHDPHERQRIQHGFSLFFPPEVMGAHIGGAVSEITGRSQSLEFRIATALVGHLGIEPNRDGLSATEVATIRRAVDWYKTEREWLHDSRCTFLATSGRDVIVRCQVSRARDRAVVVAALLDTPRAALPAPLRCPALAPDRRYRVSHIDLTAFDAHHVTTQDGATLALLGFQPPLMTPDSALLYLYEAVR